MKQFWIYWILAAFETSNWKCPVVRLGIWVHGAGKNYVTMRQSGIHCSEGKIVTGHFVAWQYLLECRASPWEDDGPSWSKCIILPSFAISLLLSIPELLFSLVRVLAFENQSKAKLFFYHMILSPREQIQNLAPQTELKDGKYEREEEYFFKSSWHTWVKVHFYLF